MSHLVIPDSTAEAPALLRSGWWRVVRQTLIEPALDLVFPPVCSGCGKVDAVLCATCQAAILSGFLPVKDAPTPGIEALAALGPFEGRLRRAIHALKYEGLQALALPLGELLALRLAATGWSRSLIIPVPLHSARQHTRGFNQADLLAQHAARRLDWPYSASILIRARSTASQVGLGHAERLANVQGAFSVTQPEAVAARCVVLVDDVYTTGATLRECALTLRRSGAAGVRALVVGQAGVGVQGQQQQPC